MSKHHHDKNADGLRRHFDAIIEWIETTFPNKRKDLMKKVDWGLLYDEYRNARLNPKKIEKKIVKLLLNVDVTKQGSLSIYSDWGGKISFYSCIRQRHETKSLRTAERHM